MSLLAVRRAAAQVVSFRSLSEVATSDPDPPGDGPAGAAVAPHDRNEAGGSGTWLERLGAFSFDLMTGCLEITGDGHDIWGAPPEMELMGLRRASILPADVDRLVKAWQQLMVDGGHRACEFRMLRPDGQVRWVRGDVDVFRDGDQGATLARGTYFDISALMSFRREAETSTAFYRTLVSVSPDYTYVRELRSGHIVYGSTGWVAAGAGTARLMPADGSLLDERMLHPADRDNVLGLNERSRHSSDGEILSVRYRHGARGDWRWMELRSTPFRRDLETGEVFEVLGVIRDISDLVEAERQLLEARDQAVAAQARYAALVEHASDLTIITDENGQISYASPAWTQLTGRPADEALGTDFATLVHPDDRGKLQHVHEALRASPGVPMSLRCRIAHSDGSWRHVERIMSNHLDDPAVCGIVSNTRDVTEREAVIQRIAHQALHDSLTDLPNRALLRDRLAHALAGSERQKRLCAVLFVDLDRFKQINDDHGHEVGDHVLRVVTARMRSAVRQGDTIARLGGDEFVVVAENVDGHAECRDLAERIRAAVAVPLALGTGVTITPGLSIGIAVAGPGDTPEDLLRQADKAMYLDKHEGQDVGQLDARDRVRKQGPA